MVGKILIVDDVATNRIVQKVRLSAAFYQPILAGDGTDCLVRARLDRPDLILLHDRLPDMTTRELLGRLSADAALSLIPVIVITDPADPAARIDALAAGAEDALSRPVADAVLLARMRSLIRARADGAAATLRAEDLHVAEPAMAFAHPGRIAVVTQGDPAAETWRATLRGTLGGDLAVFASAHDLAGAISAPEAVRMPDAFVIDMGDLETGLRILSDLRSSPGARHAAICLVQSDDSAEKCALAFDMGADDVLFAGMSAAEVVQRIQRLVQRKQLADLHRATVESRLRQAMMDPLTGLYNRRYALPQLALIGQRAVRSGTTFAVFVVDIDRFKDVNDRYGHAAGDAVLADVARRLSGNLRAGDLLARIGGEEFLAALPDITLDDAQGIALRLCRAVAEKSFELPDGRLVPITVSIGLAISDAATSAEVTVLIDDADRALLAAKLAGRNQVTMGRSAA